MENYLLLLQKLFYRYFHIIIAPGKYVELRKGKTLVLYFLNTQFD